MKIKHDKKNRVILAALLLVIVGILAYSLSPKQSLDLNNTNPVAVDKKTAAANLPPFVGGNVTKVTSEGIFFKEVNVEKYARVSRTTQIVKQVNTGDSISTEKATIDEIVPSSVIIVYYSGKPSGFEYDAAKILILE